MKEIQARIGAAKQAGLSDADIFEGIKKGAKTAAGYQAARKSGLSDNQIAADLGLNLSKPKNPKDLGTQPTIKLQAEKPSLLADIGSGMDKMYSGVAQGAEYAADGIRGGLNKLLGTNLETDRYEKYTQHKADERKAYNKARKQSGKGINVGEFIGETVAYGPLAMLGRGYGAAKVLSKPGAKITLQNSAIGAAMGGTQFAENADKRLSNMTSGAIGGAVGAGVGHKVGQAAGKVVEKGKRVAKNIEATYSPQQAAQVLKQIDQKLDDLLKPHGIKLSDLSDDVAQGLRRDAKKALDAGYDLNPKAVERKAVLDSLGIKGTKAQITGNAQQWQKEAELAKVDAGKALREKFIGDNQQLNDLLEQSIKNTHGNAVDNLGAAQVARDTLNHFDQQAHTKINQMYQAARDASGNDIVLNGSGFANDAITNLNKNYVASSLPTDIHQLIKDINTNPDMFTLGKSQELIRILNQHYNSSLDSLGKPTSASHAIGIVRNALEGRIDEAVDGLLPMNGDDAASLYRAARQAYKQHAQTVERIPFLRDAIKGVEPDRLFQKHILNGEVEPLKETVKVLNDVNPQAVANLKQQVLQHIADKAINSNGQFSPAAMDKALKNLTDRKLAVLFDPQELRHIKDIGRAAHYLVTQPAHSYVNNSNSSSGLMNYFITMLRNTKGIGAYIPAIGDQVVKPFSSMKNSVQANKAITGNVGLEGGRLPATTQQQSLIDALTKAGLLGGANLPE